MKTKEDGKKLFMMNENGNKIVKTRRVQDHRNMIFLLQWNSRQSLTHLVDVLPPHLPDEADQNITALPIDQLPTRITITPIHENTVKSC